MFITAAGLLTHYHFTIFATGGGLWIIFKLIRKHPRRLLSFIASMAGGCLVFTAIHPQFYRSFSSYQSHPQSFDWGQILHRLARVMFALGPYRFKDIIAKSPIFIHVSLILLALLVGLLIIVLIIGSRKKWRLISRLRNLDDKLLYVIFLFIWSAGSTIILYLLFVSPNHAMGGRYMSTAWPFFALLIVFLLHAIPKRKNLIAGLFCCLVALSGLTFIVADICYVRLRFLPETSNLVNNASRIVIDNPARGVLPRIMWYIPDKVEVFVAKPHDLINNQELWLSQLGDNSLYLSQISYSTSESNRQEIIDIINRHFDSKRTTYSYYGMDRKLWGMTDGYVINNAISTDK